MAHRADPTELFDIDVDELTRVFPLITADRLRLQGAQLVQAQSAQNAADSSWRYPDFGRDLLARPALAPQLLDLLDNLLRRRAAQPMWSRAAVLQAGKTFSAISCNPFANGPRADAC